MEKINKEIWIKWKLDAKKYFNDNVIKLTIQEDSLENNLFQSWYQFLKNKLTMEKSHRRLDIRIAVEMFVQKFLPKQLPKFINKFRDKIEYLKSKNKITFVQATKMNRIWKLASKEYHKENVDYDLFDEMWEPFLQILNDSGYKFNIINIFKDEIADDFVNNFYLYLQQAYKFDNDKDNEKLKEVIREVPIEIIKEVPIEIIKEVEVEKIKEIPIEIIKEVEVEKIKEIPIEIIKEVPIEIIKEVEVEKIIEVIKEIPIEKFVEVIKEVEVEKIVEVIKEVPINKIKDNLINISDQNLKNIDWNEYISKISEETKKRHFYNKEHYEIINDEIIINETHLNQLRSKSLIYEGGKKPFQSKNGFGQVFAGDLVHFIDYKFKNMLKVLSKWIGVNLKPVDLKYIEAGNFIEKLVIEHLEKNLDKLSPIYDINTGEIKKSQLFSDFGIFNWFDINDRGWKVFEEFAGRPDVIRILDKYKSIYSSENTIIEIKTAKAKNKENIIQFGIPKQYELQANYYCYLFGARKYQFVYYFLEEDDYKKISENNFVFDPEKLHITPPNDSDFSLLTIAIDNIRKYRNKLFKDGKINLENNLYNYDDFNSTESYEESLEYLSASTKWQSDFVLAKIRRQLDLKGKNNV